MSRHPEEKGSQSGRFVDPPASEIPLALPGKEIYTLQDAKRILKQQKLEAGEHMTAEIREVLKASGLPEPRRMGTPVYKALMDRPKGFSPERMLVLPHERARYLLDRGATRNNPHLPETTLTKLVPDDQVIKPEAPRKAQRLEELVRRELQASPAFQKGAK